MATRPHRPLALRLVGVGHRVAHTLTGGRIGSLEPADHAPRGKVLQAITRVHRVVYRATGGIIGGNAGGLPTLLLTTKGRKTGIERTVPLPFFRHGDDVLVVASFAGNAKHPLWYTNLVGEPNVTVQIGFKRRRVQARAATAEERPTLWHAVLAGSPIYADYQRVTERVIPIVVLPFGAK